MTTLTYQKKLNLNYLILIAGIIIMPDVALGVLSGLAHLLGEGMHLMFELFESSLDHMVEHLFHTGTRETQLIVFYSMATMALGGGYFLWRKIKKLIYALIETMQATFSSYKNQFLNYWAESAHNKFKLIAGVNLALTVVYLASF